MIATGVSRRLDQLGRVVLPMELRRTLGIAPGDGMEIFVDDDTILFRKYEPGCVFCGRVDDLVHFRGRMVCGECRDELSEQL